MSVSLLLVGGWLLVIPGGVLLVTRKQRRVAVACLCAGAALTTAPPLLLVISFMSALSARRTCVTLAFWTLCHARRIAPRGKRHTVSERAAQPADGADLAISALKPRCY
jgi:hypothetical protein